MRSFRALLILVVLAGAALAACEADPEPRERVVHTDEALRLQRMVVAVDVRRDARVPDEARAGRHDALRMRSSVMNLNG